MSPLRPRPAPTWPGFILAPESPRARDRGAPGARGRCSSVAVWVGEARRDRAPTSTRCYASEDGKCAAATRRSCATARGRARARPPLGEARPAPLATRGRATEGRVVLAGRPRPRQRAGARSRAVRPWAVDAARRSSRAPGIKDHDKVRPTWRRPARDDDRDLRPLRGRYVPETLIPALDELTAALGRCARRPLPSRRARAARRAPTPDAPPRSRWLRASPPASGSI